MKSAFLAALIFLTGMWSAHAEDCTLQKVASLELRKGPSDQPIISVTINESERQFFVNVSNPFTLISPQAVKELGLKSRSIEGIHIYSSQGPKLSEYVRVDELGFGISKAKNANLVVVPNGYLVKGIDGILSSDYLANYDLDFDFAAHLLNLFSPQHCKGKVVYWTKDYAEVPFTLSRSRHITIPVTLDGKELMGEINTDDSVTALTETTAHRKFDLTKNSPDVEIPGDEINKQTVFRHRFQTLAFEGVAIKNPLISVYQTDAMDKAFFRDTVDAHEDHPLRAPTLDIPDMQIGMNTLSKLHMYIAFKEHMLYVSAADAHN